MGLVLFKFLLLAAAAAAFANLAVQRWRDGRTRASRRAAFLDPCKEVFEDGTKAIAPTGFPRMAGRYKGHDFDLQVVPDTLNFRKLPALWLLVTLTEKQPVVATFDLMLRPRGVEVFSNFASLPQQIEIPPGFPADCALRTDNPAGLPDAALVRRHLDLLDGERAKEMIVSPKGLRTVWLVEEAQRSTYLFFRDSEMGLAPYDASRLPDLLDGLIALNDDLRLAANGAAP